MGGGGGGGGEKKGEKESLCACVCVNEREERRDRCLQCKNCFACFACMIRLQKVFSSSKSAVQESTLRNRLFLASGQDRRWQRCRITAATRCNRPTRAHTHIQGPNGNYRGPQTRGQPHRDVFGLCEERLAHRWTER